MIIYRLGKHIKSAFVGVFRNFWMSFSAATAVTITLVLVSLFAVFAININSFMGSVEKSISIRALVATSYDEEMVYNADTKKDPLGDKIRAIDGVQSVVFISKQEEWDRAMKIYGDKSNIYEKYESRNPMSHVYKINLDKNEDFELVAAKVRQLEGIKKADYGTGGVRTLLSLFDQVKNIMIFFMAALIILAVFLISNTIKLTIHSRRTEIQIMRLVGASNFYIRFPFILEGIIIGIFGAVIPIVATLSIYGRLLENFGGSLMTESLQLAGMDQIQLVALMLLGIGAFVGMIGSMVSVGRYLKV